MVEHAVAEDGGKTAFEEDSCDDERLVEEFTCRRAVDVFEAYRRRRSYASSIGRGGQQGVAFLSPELPTVSMEETNSPYIKLRLRLTGCFSEGVSSGE